MKKGINNKRKMYLNELRAYTFDEDYCNYITDDNLSEKELLKLTINDRRNRNILKNTPKKFFICDDKVIYYDSLRELNNNIKEWISIFELRTKYVDNSSLLYQYFIDTLVHINKEIDLYVKIWRQKYDITYPIITDTLVKTYIDVLMGRKMKIASRLRTVLENGFDLYYDHYSEDILDLYESYQIKILSNEEENDDLIYEFVDDVSKILANSKIRERKYKEVQ